MEPHRTRHYQRARCRNAVWKPSREESPFRESRIRNRPPEQPGKDMRAPRTAAHLGTIHDRVDRPLDQKRRQVSRKTHPLRSARRSVLMPDFPQPSDWVLAALRDGIVIPAHPLALT